jgi:hypothetical protein
VVQLQCVMLMARKTAHTPEEIVAKLRRAEVLIGHDLSPETSFGSGWRPPRWRDGRMLRLALRPRGLMQRRGHLARAARVPARERRQRGGQFLAVREHGALSALLVAERVDRDGATAARAADRRMAGVSFGPFLRGQPSDARSRRSCRSS